MMFCDFMGSRLRAKHCLAAVLMLPLTALPAMAQQDRASGASPSVQGDVNITVKTGDITTKATGGDGARATNCIGSVTSGSVKGNVSIVVNGQPRSANEGCLTSETPSNSTER